jgi:hypothetical protein
LPVPNDQGEVLDNTNVESVQNKISEEIAALNEKFYRLMGSGNSEAADKVAEQIDELEQQLAPRKSRPGYRKPGRQVRSRTANGGRRRRLRGKGARAGQEGTPPARRLLSRTAAFREWCGQSFRNAFTLFNPPRQPLQGRAADLANGFPVSLCGLSEAVLLLGRRLECYQFDFHGPTMPRRLYRRKRIFILTRYILACSVVTGAPHRRKGVDG